MPTVLVIGFTLFTATQNSLFLP